MRIRILIIVLLLSNLIFSQVSDTYQAYAKLANEYFEKKDYVNAAAFYSMAFYTMHDRGIPSDRYRAAIAYAGLNQTDSAFKNLLRLAERTEFLNCEIIEAEPEFVKLKKDACWTTIRNKTCGTNFELHKVLVQIHYTDQAPRAKLDSISSKFGANSRQMDSLWDVIRNNDSTNLEKVDSIHQIYGWPGPNLVGKQGNISFWLVIQHSDLSIQEKYFPFMQQAVLKNTARARDCAYLEDRILNRKKLPQKYGTQYQYNIVDNKIGKSRLCKLQDKENVNKYRQEVGLPPLSKQDLDDALELMDD